MYKHSFSSGRYDHLELDKLNITIQKNYMVPPIEEKMTYVVMMQSNTQT